MKYAAWYDCKVGYFNRRHLCALAETGLTPKSLGSTFAIPSTSNL